MSNARELEEDAEFISDSIFTGKAIFYLHSCPVLAWLHLHGQLVVDPWQEYIRSGKDLDSYRFSNKRTLDLSPYGKCDWVTGTRSDPVIHEGSRSRYHNEPKRAQLRHYLWAARELYGLEATGQLHLVEGNVEAVLPDDGAVRKDHGTLLEIQKTQIPYPKHIPICKGCSNRDWCWQ